MNQQIEELFSALLKKPKIAWAEVTNFGSQIAPTLLNSSDSEIKNTMDTIYLGLIRKGHAAFDAFDSNYDYAAIQYLRTGINDTIRNTVPLDQAYEFSVKLKELNTEKHDLSTLITKQVAICLGENVNEDTMNLKLHHLSNEIIRYTSHSQPELKKNPQQITEAYNNVYDEFSFHNRLELLPQFATITIRELNDFNRNNNQIKSVIQGLSNLKDANTDTLDFSQLLQKLTVKSNDSISLLFEKYFKEPTDSMLNSVVEDLTKEIISQPLKNQANLWDKVREEFLTPVFENNSLKKTDIKRDIANIAINFINTTIERDNLIKGISGMLSTDKRDNLSASITSMRHKFTGDSSVATNKIK